MVERVDAIKEELEKVGHIETVGERLRRKARENPFVPIGLLGMVGAGAVSGYHYKTRPIDIPPSLYLMQTRIIAQGTAVGCLAAGVAYTLYRLYREEKK